jgi:hypothetical protein
MISTEVEVARIKLLQSRRNKGKESLSAISGSDYPNATTKMEETSMGRAAELKQAYAGINKMAIASAKALGRLADPVTVVKRDFFGRPIIGKDAKHSKLSAFEGESRQTVAASPVIKSAVSFKYHEGVSNAVRRNIKIKEFFRIDEGNIRK